MILRPREKEVIIPCIEWNEKKEQTYQRAFSLEYTGDADRPGEVALRSSDRDTIWVDLDDLLRAVAMLKKWVREDKR